MSNPLQRYFRQPAIYITLPSKGKFYPPGTLEPTPNDEYPVYPMTAMDEITYRTADALFNGSAIVNVIKSCVPNIKDPWSMPQMDLDSILIGIRIATYGHELEFESKCPSCNEENNYGVDLRIMLDQITPPDYSKTVVDGDIEIYFKPMSYKTQNASSLAQFEDQKLLEVVPTADLPEEQKIQMINEAFVKLGALNLNSIADSISLIKAGDDVVDNHAFILEFVQNCDRSVFNKIRDYFQALRKDSAMKPLQIECRDCGHKYESPFTLDVASFFALNS